MKVRKALYMLMVQDMERGVRFYSDVLGLDVALHTPGWSELTLGGATVALHGGGTGEQTKTGLSFEVEDIDDACRQVQDGGGRLLRGPILREAEGIRLADVADTEGNVFFFSSPVA